MKRAWNARNPCGESVPQAKRVIDRCRTAEPSSTKHANTVVFNDHISNTVVFNDLYNLCFGGEVRMKTN